MRKLDYLLCFFLSTLAFISRTPIVEKFQSHWDGPDYSIAVVRYSLQQDTPTSPGYPLYIALGKFFYIFFHDPHVAILAVSVLGSIAGVIVFYLVGKALFNRSVGIIASFLLLTGSTFYYFGLTPYAYGLLPATTTILAYSVYRIIFKNKQEGFFFGLIFGICFGIRPQETLFIGPLAAVGGLYLNKKQKIYAALVFSVITLIWLIPLIAISGGLTKYIEANLSAAKNDFAGVQLIQRIVIMIKGFLLSFGISSIFLLYYIIKFLKTKNISQWRWIFFYGIWIIPVFCFNLFIRTDHAGYQMSYLAGFLLLISYAVWRTTQKSKFLMGIVILAIALFNLYWFFYNRDPNYTKPYRPTSFHYSDIRKNDLKVGSKVTFIQERFNPKSTLIIALDVLWRPYSYYLKSYPFVVIFGLDNKDIPYIYNRIDAIDWNIHWYQTRDFTISIPSNISTIVFVDDNVYKWIKNYPYT